MAKKTSKPKMVRTQFEEEDFSYAGGGALENIVEVSVADEDEDIEGYLEKSFVKIIFKKATKIDFGGSEGKAHGTKYKLSDGGHFQTAEDFIDDIEGSVVLGDSKIIKNKTYAGGGRIKEIEDEIAEYEVLIADKSVPQDEKEFAKGEIEDLKKELKGLEEKPAEKKAPAKAKAPAKPAPTPKAKAKAPAKKKPDTEHPTCEELEKKWNERREQAKKAAKKHKTVSVSEQIGNNIASAVGKVIDDIAAKDIEKNPTKYIDAFEEVEDAFKTAMGKLKPLLGDDFNSKELTDPFEEILGKFIEQIKTKYGKK